MIDLDPELVAVLAVAGLGLSLALLGVVAVLAVRLHRVRGVQRRACSDGSAHDVVGRLDRHEDELAAVRRDVATVHTNTEHLRGLLRGTVSRVGVVRYDAFGDMGGATSFSAALLDEGGTGLVLSAINGRTEARCYAKTVALGRSEHDHDLSFEEEEAVTAAIEGRPAAPVRHVRPRRRRRAS